MTKGELLRQLSNAQKKADEINEAIARLSEPISLPAKRGVRWLCLRFCDDNDLEIIGAEIEESRIFLTKKAVYDDEADLLRTRIEIKSRKTAGLVKIIYKDSSGVSTQWVKAGRKIK